MDATRRQLLTELERHGDAHDANEPDRLKRYRNITPDTGRFIALLVLSTDARNVLEVGTSNGYSTIWLADAAARTGGHVTTLEADEPRSREATNNIDLAKLGDRITQERGSAADVLPTLPAGSFDLLFLDAERTEYMALWPSLARVLKPSRGLIVVDNAVSHAHELVDFTTMLEEDPQFETSLVPVGKGEFLAVRVV